MDVVPPNCPLSLCDLQLLKLAIDPCRKGDVMGTDIFLEVVDFVVEKLAESY